MAANASRKSTIDDAEVREDLAALRDDFSQLRGDVQELVHSLTNAGKSAASNAGHRVAETASRVAEDMQERAGRATNAVEEQVHERPFTSVGVAFAAGLTIGALVLGRKSN